MLLCAVLYYLVVSNIVNIVNNPSVRCHGISEIALD